MSSAKYSAMGAELKKWQQNDSKHNPRSEVRIPDQTHLPVVSLEFLNCMNRKELTIGDEKAWFPLVYEEVEGPIEPEQLVYLQITDGNLENLGLPQGSFALLNPNLPIKSGDFACVRWKGVWSFGRIDFAEDGHAKLEYAPGKFLWLAAEEKHLLDLIVPMVDCAVWKPLRDFT